MPKLQLHAVDLRQQRSTKDKHAYNTASVNRAAVTERWTSCALYSSMELLSRELSPLRTNRDKLRARHNSVAAVPVRQVALWPVSRGYSDKVLTMPLSTEVEARA